MTSRVLLIAFLLLLPFGVIAQDCSLTFSGTVTDEKGQPLVGAYVIMSPGGGQVTDVEGRFLFANLCSRKYHIEIRFLGYAEQQIDKVLTQSEELSIKLVPEALQLQEIVVQEELAHTEHAVNYSRLNQQILEELAGKSLGETLKEVPGVSSIQAGPGIFKPVIHGVHSQRVLILNHGIRQEGQQWGAEHAPEIDPFMASNITVIKDAAAIKYGGDALGGVIVVNPPQLPTSSGVGGYLNAVGTSNGRSGTLSGMLEGGLDGFTGWGWRAQGTVKRAGDFFTPDYQLTNTGFREVDYSASVGFHDDSKGFEVFFSHFETDLGILRGTAVSSIEDLRAAMDRDTPQGTQPFSYDISEPRQEVSHNLLKLNAHYQGEEGEWRLQYGFQENKRKEFDIRRGSLENTPSINLSLNTHTFELEWEKIELTHKHLCFGMSAMYQSNQNIFGTQRIPFIPNYSSLSSGLFAVADWELGKWLLDAGVRYDYRAYQVKGFDFKNTFYTGAFQFNNFSATMGVSRQWNGSKRFSSSVSTAWRPPHVAELYSVGTHQSAAAIEYGLLLNDSTNEVMDIDAVNFQAEKAVKWVSSYSRKFGHVSMEAAAYANYIFNYIYLRAQGVTETLRGVYPYFKYSQTDALFVGADWEWEWEVTPHWTADAKASLLRVSDVTNNDYLISIPSNQYQVGIRWEGHDQLGLDGLYASARLRYVDQQRRAPRVIAVDRFIQSGTDGSDPLDGSSANFDFMAAPGAYFLLNASAGFRTGKKVKYDLRVSVDNALNNPYREYTNRFRYYADEIGRNFIISFKCTF
ncbi:MAG: TonB-dependent receptor [Cyclobacteriaceae bacterium]